MENGLKNKNKTVVIGLSGGVDSAVAAYILKKQGYTVIGAFMKNFSDTKNLFTGECSYLEDKKMAQRIAFILDIKFVVFDFEKEYKKYVIDKMYSDYRDGITPNPDILCNKIIKFPLFYKSAKKLGADIIAMGHYAIIKKSKSGYNLFSGKDSKKDQSYFLSELSQEDLKHTLFPLGDYTKEQVRYIAKRLKLPNWDRHGTVGVCFVGNVNMKEFLEKKIRHKIGKVLDENKNIIGTHQGIQYYTIGQKSNPSIGININKTKENSQKRYYIAKKIKPNTLLVAPEGSPLLKNNIINIKSLHIINPNEPIPKFNLKIRIRHLGNLNEGKLRGNKFILSKPIESITPGQIAVIYHKNKVIASGEIN